MPQDKIEFNCDPEFLKDGIDSNLEKFLNVAKKQSQSTIGIYTKGNRKSLLIVNPETKQVGYCDLSKGGRFPLTMDLIESFKRNLEDYHPPVDATKKFRENDAEKTAYYDIRPTGFYPEDDQQAILIVQKRMAAEQVVKPGLLSGQGIFNMTERSTQQTQPEKIEQEVESNKQSHSR